MYDDSNTLKTLIRNTRTRDCGVHSELVFNFINTDAHEVKKLLTEHAENKLRKERENLLKQSDDGTRYRFILGGCKC